MSIKSLGGLVSHLHILHAHGQEKSEEPGLVDDVDKHFILKTLVRYDIAEEIKHKREGLLGGLSEKVALINN